MSSFEQIAQALRQQKLFMDKLETENRELREQLAALRSGAGIFVEIAGRRFPLQGRERVLGSIAQSQRSHH